MTEVTFRSDVRVEVVDHMGDDTSPVRAARVSTGTDMSSDPRKDLALLNRLVKDGHMVPFETQIVTFYIEAPIFVTRQMLKHRISSISETSGRYREMLPEFYVPGPDRPVKQVGKTMDYRFEDDAALNAQAGKHIEMASLVSWNIYQVMLDEGVAKEMARVVLPTNLYSSLYITMNTRSLLNFFHLRTSDYLSHPQYEMEQVAQGMMVEWGLLYPGTLRAAVEAGVL